MIIIHDFFRNNGGGENLIRSISKEINCKIFSTFNNLEYNKKIITPYFSKILKINNLFIFFYFLFFFKIDTKENILFSGTYSFLSINRCVAKKKILYAHSLPKSLYPKLYKERSYPWHLFFFRRLLIKLYYKNISSIDYMFFNSNKTRNKFLLAFPNLKKNKNNKVLYPYSDLKFLKKNTNNLKKKYFVINSRHQPYKNLNLIISKLSDYIKDKDLNILITQTGEQTKSLKNTYKNNSKIKFLNYLNINDYQNLIINSLAVIFPSRDEDFGIAALDAYNLNIPVIIQKNCGFSEILNGDYQFFYNKKNIIYILNKLFKDNYSKEIYKEKLNLKEIFFREIKVK